MPSPVGHALAGLITAWAVERFTILRGSSTWHGLTGLTVLCVALAVAPDLDHLYMPYHRTVTHSVSAVLLVTIIAAAVTRQVTGRVGWILTLTCATAYGSHIVLDWLGADASTPRGIEALWPFSRDWYISSWSLFPGIERRDPLSARALLINLRALVAEILLLGPVALMLWRLRRAGDTTRTRRSRVRISGQDARPQPSGGAADRPGTSDRPALRAARSEWPDTRRGR